MARVRDFRISVYDGAPDDAVMEAARRMNFDGIPRTVFIDGKIMKWDWHLDKDSLEDNLEGESLEEHIKAMLDGQQG